MAQRNRTYMDDVRSVDPIFFLIVGTVVGFLAATVVFNSKFLNREFLDGLAPEAVGIALTVLVLDRLSQRREHQRESRELKAQLTRQMRSHDNVTARNAIEELRERNWLRDGTLKGANLIRANLQEANLIGANLQEARLLQADLQKVNLMDANLQWAFLYKANLQGADLVRGNLQEANLQGTNFQEANLHSVNLQGAYLRWANLQGTSLWIANLKGADLQNAKFDEETALPDDFPLGERSFWTSDTDMGRFTDPNHPDFWQSPVWNDT